MNAILSFAKSGRIWRRDPDDLLHTRRANRPDETISEVADLRIAQVAIHPVGPELDNDDGRTIAPNESFHFWGERRARLAAVHEISVNRRAIWSDFAITAVRVEARLIREPV